MSKDIKNHNKISYLRADVLDVIELGNEGKAILLFTVNEWEDQVLPMIIDASAAFSIRKALLNIPFPRPLTHDLIMNILERLDVSIEKITIDAMINGMYLATIVLKDNRTGELIHVDSRPSDAAAIAVRSGAPIYIAEHLRKYAEPASLYLRLLGNRRT
ncbi:MAG: hypothetical protein B6V02_02215 [Thermoprotei archaeon ex4572_64]|nr:MAG: hypothetical protein B6V02_02215 [Thermoprotei archaeon ex4572_64]